MAERFHEMPQTKGTYQIRGIVSGVDKSNFYSEKKTRNGKNFRMINFGVQYDENKYIYESLNGMPRDKVYFSKRDRSTGKTSVKPVNWENRNDPQGEDFRIIGVSIGLEKHQEEKSVPNKNMTEYDACKYINEHLKDEMSVLTTGNIEYGSYTNRSGQTTRNVKFVPSKISLCRDEVDFSTDSSTGKEKHAFKQVIVFKGIEKEVENDKPTGRFILSAYIVNYSTVEEAEFFIKDAALANQFRKRLKPYNSINVCGDIEVTNEVENETDDDWWGEKDKMTVIHAPTRRELIITGADGKSIDTDTYNEYLISEAIRKQNAANKAEEKFNAGSNNSEDDWGETPDSDEDDDLPW